METTSCEEVKLSITGTIQRNVICPMWVESDNSVYLVPATHSWFLRKPSSHDAGLDKCRKHGWRIKEEMSWSTSWVSRLMVIPMAALFSKALFFLSGRTTWSGQTMLAGGNINTTVLLWFPDYFSQQRRAGKAVFRHSSCLVSPADHTWSICSVKPPSLLWWLQEDRDRRGSSTPAPAAVRRHQEQWKAGEPGLHCLSSYTFLPEAFIKGLSSLHGTWQRCPLSNSYQHPDFLWERAQSWQVWAR